MENINLYKSAAERAKNTGLKVLIYKNKKKTENSSKVDNFV